MSFFGCALEVVYVAVVCDRVEVLCQFGPDMG